MEHEHGTLLSFGTAVLATQDRTMPLFTEAALKILYVQSYMISIQWEKVFSPVIHGFLDGVAACLNTTIEGLFTHIIGLDSGALGLKAALDTGKGYLLYGNTILWTVGRSSSGKTNVYRGLVLPVMTRIVKICGKVSPFIQAFTSQAGILKAMQRNGGSVTMHADEVGHLFQRPLSKRNDDCYEFRRLVNTTSSNSNYSREYAASSGYRMDRTFLAVNGTTHPDVLCDVLSKTLEVQDGLTERILAISIPATKTSSANPVENYVQIFTKTMEAMKRQHDAEEPVIYRLSEGAKELMTDWEKKTKTDDIDELSKIEVSRYVTENTFIVRSIKLY